MASLACLVVGNFAIDPGALELPIVPPAPTLGGGLLIFTAISALLLGVALPLLGMAGPTAQLRPNQPAWQGWPLFVIVLVAAVLCFPAALVILGIMYLGRRDFDRSWLIIAVAALVWTFSMTFRADDSQVPELLKNSSLWWAGRLAYPPLALGWVLGSTQIRD